MRTARLNVPGALHHLIWRFVDRSWYFNTDDERDRYLWWLGRALDQTDWRCLGYALMSNHIHLAMIAGDEALANWSRRANAPFALWMNERYRRLGPLFSDRAKDYALAPTRTAILLAYIHNNPVRAGVVSSADDSSWTSYRAYTGLAATPRWLHVGDGLRRCGFSSRAQLAAFTQGSDDTVGAARVDEIARAVKRRGDIVVATPDEHVVPLVMRPFARLRPDPLRILELVCRVLGIAPTEARSRRRSPRLVYARRVIAHCGRALGIAGSDLGAALGVTEQAISKIALHTTAPTICSASSNSSSTSFASMAS